MTLQDFQYSLPALGAVAASGWFFWQRYQALEQRLTAADKDRAELRHMIQMGRLAEQSNVDRLELFCNGNKELINHRSDRFKSAIEAMEKRLSRDIEQIQAFLDKTTEFRIRD